LLCVACQFDNVSGVFFYQLNPVIHCKDAVPEPGKSVTEFLSVDDLHAAQPRDQPESLSRNIAALG
jgi:hypothetical protein